MTVHAHPDDETIGTGGTMAKAVAAGHRVVLVTCTRGEMGEIVVPDMDTPDNHRRLGEIRAGELERAMGAPRRDRVGEPRLPRLGHDGLGPATATRARSGRPTSTRRPGGWSGSSAATSPTSSRPTTSSAATATPTTSGPTTSRSGRSRGPATRPGTRSSSRPSTAGPARVDEGGLAPWAPSKLYEQAIPASVRDAMRETVEASRQADRSGRRPTDATPEQIAEFEAFAAKMLVPDEVDHDLGRHLRRAARARSGRAIHEHVTQISDDSPFMLFGLDGWRDGWANEAYILRESRRRVDAARDGPLRRDRLSPRGGPSRPPRTAAATTRAAGPSTRRTPGP